ncbi:DUF2627 domain-containing protein [Salinicoccus sp. ID82-1]|uniref:DUF2627 domain-containing protein n=1 Tax=Salinicoccus cyprini TaxID=2493691 RepID=A0A558AZ45_9STAP|nr:MULTISPECIES: DUF2627 domain-containing protein [Salinicoccus]MCG1009046.1 DUF2627 domain-containing protein [Salinicoccus sp. ID82-1]TVT29494.1 DUF2627 domain-containing protein [Salinicoccus cyprini]
MKKIIALAILVIPVFLAGLGIKYMRDSVFGIVNDPFTLTVVQFIVGLLLTAAGVWFIGGYILHREQRQKKMQAQFLEQANKTEDENRK